MSIERELVEKIGALVDQLTKQNEINQRILEVLIDVLAEDDPNNQPLRDMDGNPV